MHWVVYINEIYIDSFGCVPANKLSRFIMKRNELCSLSEFKIQGVTSKRDSYCAGSFLYIFYLTIV